MDPDAKSQPMTFEASELDIVAPKRQVPAAIEWMTRELDRAGVPTALGDAQIIIAHLLDCTRADVQRGGGRHDRSQRRAVGERGGAH